MNVRNFEKSLLCEKQYRFRDVVLKTSKKLSIILPNVKFWDGFCPSTLNEEVAHIHIGERLICISNHWLKALDYDEIDHIAVHETTHLVESQHDENFQLQENEGEVSLWHSRKK